MDRTVLDILDRILRFRRSSTDNTKRLSRMGHDRDLLPAFQRKLERVLESYGKLNPIAYDMQGIRDQGVDIGIRQQNQAGEYESLIGFQIKSQGDLAQKDFMQKLKAQHFDALSIKNLQQYYIVPCVDEDANKKRLRAIEAEFKTAQRTKIIEPTYADFFLSLSQEQIDAYIYRTFATGDVVIKKARGVVDFSSRMTGAVVCFLTVQSFLGLQRSVKISEVMAAASLRRFHRRLLEEAEIEFAPLQEIEDKEGEEVIEFDEILEVDESFEDQIVQDLEAIRDNVAIINDTEITVRFDQVAPIVALATDALVRYDYPPQSLTGYLIDLLGLSD